MYYDEKDQIDEHSARVPAPVKFSFVRKGKQNGEAKKGRDDRIKDMFRRLKRNEYRWISSRWY